MAKVIINQFLADLMEIKDFTEERELRIDANSVRNLIKKIEQDYPGVGEKLRHGVTIAIDGELISDALLEPIEDHNEIYFLPAIEGG